MKVREELEEFEEEMKGNSSERLMQEFGDLLFAFINVARFYKINPEEALFHTNQKFIRRFTYVEERAKENGKDFADYTLMELDAFWNEAKSKEL